ncbi:DUF4286 family protein [Microbacterium immunditiarum]|uniref:EthD domain-containing protein n=1 Tax=Microbacterium immunditiarum TaxID=337480 RepID=A0A7Y9GLT5_9MICO|nr:DUF4286 family protein [Microbacterium immunditiarum]NYE18794.1 hypothetical protein [Microbacterium immunditiarum]
MATSLFIVHTNPVEGRESEFEDWYTNRHLADVVAIPGFVRARRYRLADAQFAPLADFRYAAVYEIDGDPADAMRALRHALKAGLEVSSSMAQPVYATVYEPITEWVTEQHT